MQRGAQAQAAQCSGGVVTFWSGKRNNGGWRTMTMGASAAIGSIFAAACFGTSLMDLREWGEGRKEGGG